MKRPRNGITWAWDDHRLGDEAKVIGMLYWKRRLVEAIIIEMHRR